MSVHIDFLEIFPCCGDLRAMCGGLENAKVLAVTVDRDARNIQVKTRFKEPPAPAELSTIEACLANEFELNKAEIKDETPAANGSAASGASGKPRKAPAAGGDIIMGKPVSRKPSPVEGLSTESGNVCVSGKVFATDSRELPKHKAAVLSFCITDGTGSVHVSKFIRDGDAERRSVDRIKDGMYLLVSGNVAYNRYDEDIALDPKNIQIAPAPAQRSDDAPEKRVELHMHTRYSALDALGDPADIVKRAAKWGHKAVAITDHGVAQAFPEAWHAAQKAGVKVIYGLEGYYINDVDEKLCIHGHSELPLDCEMVAFDVETTGLSPERDRLTEIGALIFSGDKIIAEFNTFVNPKMPIPPDITRLTGIKDSDVADAPGEEEALRAFLAFAGDRPLAAHNADFDVSFLDSAARRSKLSFDPVYLDTLTLSQTLLPNLKRHKLNIVSDFLSLPEFRHHRASDDAMVVARIMDKFSARLREYGALRLCDIEEALLDTKRKGVRNQRPKHIILLVKNSTGLKNLYELISKSHLEHFKRFPIILKSLITKHREGLIVGTACEAGEFYQAVLRGQSDTELRRIADFYDYLEIQPMCNNRFLIDNGRVRDNDELRDLNRRIAKIASLTGKPLVATGDVHFIDPEDEIYRRILLAPKFPDDADRPLPIYFKTTEEMLEEFSYLGQELCHRAVIDNPVKIAEMCEDIELLPKELFVPTIENSAEDLKRLVYERVTELYGENPPPLVTQRVETELHDILARNYDVIYMSAQKLVADSLEHGYLVGSRGSVGSSIVAFMSGITEVNSLPAHYRCKKCRHSDFESGHGYGCGADMPDRDCPVCGEKLFKDGFDIPFETFLGFGGDKVPDIDLNFSGEYQANAHRYTETLFGKDHVFRAGTIGTLAEKTAFGYVKKYLEERQMKVTKAEETRLALGCVGVKRTTGQHPGGLVIIPQNKDVTDFCPVQHPADDADSGIITTHFEYHCMEDNLLKLDELGHDDPTMIKMLEDMTGVNAREIPLDDHDTMEIFRSPKPLGLPEDDRIIGKTGSIGIPEFGTGFTRQMLVDTQPEGFDILVRLSGFSHGTDVWLGNAKDLITSGTASVRETVGCRDDIMLYLISVGIDPKVAFKIMESVRKGKIKKNGFEPGWEEQLFEHGVPAWYIESLAKIAYLFPKAHAVAYVMMAFRIAYFKVHYPLAFYSTYFYRRSQKDAFDAEKMTLGIDTVRKEIGKIEANPKPTAKEEDLLTTLEAVYEFYLRGFSFAGVDLYESDSTRFLTVGEKQLRPPFVSISGLGEAAASDLAACKEKGIQFVSVEDVSAACPKVSQTHIETLKNLGALGDLPDESQMSFF